MCAENWKNAWMGQLLRKNWESYITVGLESRLGGTENVQGSWNKMYQK